MTEEQARARYQETGDQWRALDRCVNNLTVFGNQKWTPEMLIVRRELLALLRTRMKALADLMDFWFSQWRALVDEREAAQLVETTKAA